MKGTLESDGSFGADDHRLGRRKAIESRRKSSLISLGIRQDGRKLAVDPAGIGLAEAYDLLGNAENFCQE